MRASLASPTYGPTDVACQKSLRVAALTAANHGLQWAGDLSTDRMGWGHARNTTTNMFYEHRDKSDGIIWIDSDMILPAWAMWKMMSEVKKNELDFVTGIYFQRGKPFFPLIYDFRPCEDSFSIEGSFPSDCLHPVKGCGFGFVWTSKRLIEKIYDHPDFSETKGWFPDERFSGGKGEDLSFCYQAMNVGITPVADTSIILGHSGEPYVYSMLDYINHIG